MLDFIGGAERDRTADLLVANEALSQLSYSPTFLGALRGGTAATPDNFCECIKWLESEADSLSFAAE